MSDIVDNLRSEIVESEKARIDLLKWKIILIAALGTVGFGIGKEGTDPMPVLLGFIPLVCAYVDVLCVHNNLRILVIARFLRTDSAAANSGARAYEELCQQQRPSFALESLALVGTTVGFAALVAFISLSPDSWKLFVARGEPLAGKVVAFLGITAALGFAVSVGATLFQRARAKVLSEHKANAKR